VRRGRRPTTCRGSLEDLNGSMHRRATRFDHCGRTRGLTFREGHFVAGTERVRYGPWA
jgi:hypothetical protein